MDHDGELALAFRRIAETRRRWRLRLSSPGTPLGLWRLDAPSGSNGELIIDRKWLISIGNDLMVQDRGYARSCIRSFENIYLLGSWVNMETGNRLGITLPEGYGKVLVRYMLTLCSSTPPHLVFYVLNLRHPRRHKRR